MKREAELYHKVEGETVVCDLCHHRCRIASGKRGVCRTRRNEGGKLVSLVYARCIAMNVDPIEKKPLFHFLPGTHSLSVATIGCNFRCSFCQNYLISQTLNDGEVEKDEEIPGRIVPPEDLVHAAVAEKCQSISYTYTEPTVFFEYALDTARLACEAGIANCFVSNGYMTPEAIDVIKPYLHAINVDLKSFDPKVYLKVMGGRLDGVLETIRYLHQKKIWLEITTLLVPDMNDSPEEVRQIARFIAGLSPDIPWHISRFYPQYKMDSLPPTSIKSIEEAARIGEEEGLHYIYCGNVPGDPRESTHCASCGHLLIGRVGYQITEREIRPDGSCPSCGALCPGIWRFK